MSLGNSDSGLCIEEKGLMAGETDGLVLLQFSDGGMRDKIQELMKKENKLTAALKKSTNISSIYKMLLLAYSD